MNFETIFASGQNFSDALGMVFLHSLWQFTVIATVVSWILKKNKIQKSPARYAFALLSMAGMVVTALVTFAWYLTPETIHYSGENSFTAGYVISPESLNGEWKSSLTFFEAYQDLIIFIWMTGALLLTLRWIGSLLYLEWLKKSSLFPGAENPVIRQWLAIRKRWDIHKNFTIGFSKNIQSPVLIGHLKPVILFPLGIINQLSPEETECILLHELAHYARCDYWANLLQSIVEILFYYHPAVYYISRLIREERENCCDEYAIHTMGGQNIMYAKTLVKLQEWESGLNPGLAVAFTGKNKIFSDRIKKILHMNPQKNAKSENILIGLIIVSSLFFATRETIASNISLQGNKDYLSAIFQFVKPDFQKAVADSLPVRKESITIIKKEDDKEVKVQMENGEIKRLEIDGKEIKPEEYDQHKEITKDIQIRTFRKNKGEDPFFFFDLDDKGMRWNGKMEMKWDSMLKDFSFDGMENHSFRMEDFQKEMQRLQEKMKDKNFHFFKLDSMMALQFPDKNMQFHFHGDGIPGFEKEFNFEFDHPGDRKIIKKYKFSDEMDVRPGNNINEVLGTQLNRDGLLIPNKENKVELTGKTLRINGEKQPSNIWNKYKRIFEEETGTTLEKNSRISFHFWGKEAKRKYKAL